MRLQRNKKSGYSLLVVLASFTTVLIFYVGASLNRSETLLRQSYHLEMRAQAQLLAEAAIAEAQAQDAWQQGISGTMRVPMNHHGMQQRRKK